MTLAAAAAVTERVRLACHGDRAADAPAVLIAKQIATLDVLSGGRVVLGVGVGARADDYPAVDAPFDTRRLRRMERAGRADAARLGGRDRGRGRGAAGRAVPAPARRPAAPRRRAGRRLDPPRGALGRRPVRLQLRPVGGEVALASSTARAAWHAAARPAPRLVTSCWFALGRAPRAQLDAYLRSLSQLPRRRRGACPGADGEDRLARSAARGRARSSPTSAPTSCSWCRPPPTRTRSLASPTSSPDLGG